MHGVNCTALWRLKETDLASGELGICVGVATCRLITGEGDRGKEKDPIGTAGTSLPVFCFEHNPMVLKLLIWGPVRGDWEAQGGLGVLPKAFLSFTLVVKKLNELYKSSVSSCHCLNMRLQRFLLDKQKLMDRINSITAEKLIFSYAVQMVITTQCLGTGLAQSECWAVMVPAHDAVCCLWVKEVLRQRRGHWVWSGGNLLERGCCCRYSLQPWMRCSTTERTVHRGTTRLCCSWRGS